MIISNFDVVLFCVMHGWMQLNEITHECLVEAVELSNELLGATTVVLITIPFTNNVITEEDMAMVSEINEDMDLALEEQQRHRCSKCTRN